MIFKRLIAKNILSIGEEGIDISFDKYGNIVIIKGINLDISPQSSNGAGKSTIIECIVYGLFGKFIKDLNHKQAINKKIKKNLLVEFSFEIDGIPYKVIRKRAKDSLDFFKGDVKANVGGAPETQKEIEKAIKYNYSAFINVVCFGEHNNHAFLSCEPDKKRIIVENLLGLEKYLKYCDTAKKSLKSLNSELEILLNKYNLSLEQKENCSRRLVQFYEKQKDWQQIKKKEISLIEADIVKKTNELSVTDDGSIKAYDEAQKRLTINKDELVKCEEQRGKISTALDELKGKLEEIQVTKNTLNLEAQQTGNQVAVAKSNIKAFEAQLVSLNGLKNGVKCSACHGLVDVNNYKHLIEYNSKEIDKLKDYISTKTTECNDVLSKLKSVNDKISTINTTKKMVDDKSLATSSKINKLISDIQRDSQIKEPHLGTRELLLREQLNELQNKLKSKLDEVDNHDPYRDIIKQVIEEESSLNLVVEESKALVKEKEDLMPYYEYWIFGFGDNGIRSYLIDEILPALNARVNYWLQFLIDNKIKLTFDNKFDALIERNPSNDDDFVYEATSGGEKRRINLAISQAFAYVMMLSSGTCPNFVSLDEVALNIDAHGVQGVYNMICELARERQVFVTSHDPNLNDLLGSCDIITIVKKDGFSTLNKE